MILATFTMLDPATLAMRMVSDAPLLRPELPSAPMSAAVRRVLATLAARVLCSPRNARGLRPIATLPGFGPALACAMAAAPSLPVEAFLAAGRHRTGMRAFPTTGAFGRHVLDVALVHAARSARAAS